MPFPRRFRLLVVLPRPAPLDLHLEREGQERADEDDEAEYAEAPGSRIAGDRPDDVGGDEELEPEEDCLAEIPSLLAVCRGEPVPAPEQLAQEDDGGDEGPDQDHRNPDHFDPRGHPVHNTVEDPRRLSGAVHCSERG
jgi:hypothetical protein